MAEKESIGSIPIQPSFEVGQVIEIEVSPGAIIERKIINITDTAVVAQKLKLLYKISKPIPVIVLNGSGLGHQAAYHPTLKAILIYGDTRPEVVHHELIHSLEQPKPTPEELLNLYEIVKLALPDMKNIQPNFRKNIHEFIADAYSKPGFINTLTRLGLYDDFLRMTRYIFE